MPIQVLASEPTDTTFNAYVRVDQGGLYFMSPLAVTIEEDDLDDDDEDGNEQILTGEAYFDVYLAFHAEDYELQDPQAWASITMTDTPWAGWVQLRWLEVPLPISSSPGSWTSPAVGLRKRACGKDVRSRRPLLGYYAAHTEPLKDPYTEQIGSASIWVP